MIDASTGNHILIIWTTARRGAEGQTAKIPEAADRNTGQRGKLSPANDVGHVRQARHVHPVRHVHQVRQLNQSRHVY